MKKNILLVIIAVLWVTNAYAANEEETPNLAWEQAYRDYLEEQKRLEEQKKEEEEDGEYKSEEEEDKAKEKEIFKLDDKTKPIYGPKTIFFIHPDTIKYNEGDYQPVDKLSRIDDLHRFTFIKQHQHQWQDLGTNGTAIRPILFILPKTIGSTSGFYVYDPYFKTPNQFVYYNTKSPYVNVYVALGRKRRTRIKIPYSQNINENWNINFTFSNIISDKQYATLRGEENVESYHYDFSTHYKTPDNTYQVLAGFLHMKHRVKEIGEITESSINKRKERKERRKHFFSNNINVYRSEQYNFEKRRQYHLYHQYEVWPDIQFYHEGVVLKKWNTFGFENESIYKYPKHLRRQIMYERENMQNNEERYSFLMLDIGNEGGIKGNIDKLFYSVYYRRNNIQHDYYDQLDKIHENYIGFTTRYTLQEDLINEQKDTIALAAEYLFGGLHKVRLAYDSKWVDVHIQNMRYKPSLLAHYHNRRYGWPRNHFDPIQATQGKAGVKLSWQWLTFNPHCTLTHVRKPMYFTYLCKPKQREGSAWIITTGTQVDLTLWQHIHLDNLVLINQKTGKEAPVFHMPTLLTHSCIYYQNYFFENSLLLKIGFDIYGWTKYVLHKYEPHIQQFYLPRAGDQKDGHEYPEKNPFDNGYVVADFFINGQISNFCIFVKMTHCNKPSQQSYFVTPGYLGPNRSVDFGISWSFFE